MNTYNLLGPTNMIEDIDFVGDAVNAAGWYGIPDGLHTVAFYTNGFTGRIFLEGSLSMDPQCNDWFPIKLTNCDYIEYPEILGNNLKKDINFPTPNVIGFTFRSNILWLRVKVWRSYFLKEPSGVLDYKSLGSISKIVVGF